MEKDLIKITPNKEKAKSILNMVRTTLEMVDRVDKSKFSSNITKEYYEIIRELVTIVLLLDGYKTIGEGAHKRMIEYLEANYKQFSKSEIYFIDDLRIVRNKIAYDGFFVKKDFIDTKLKSIQGIIEKLKKIIDRKLND